MAVGMKDCAACGNPVHHMSKACKLCGAASPWRVEAVTAPDGAAQAPAAVAPQGSPPVAADPNTIETQAKVLGALKASAVSGASPPGASLLAKDGSPLPPNPASVDPISGAPGWGTGAKALPSTRKTPGPVAAKPSASQPVSAKPPQAPPPVVQVQPPAPVAPLAAVAQSEPEGLKVVQFEPHVVMADFKHMFGDVLGVFKTGQVLHDFQTITKVKLAGHPISPASQVENLAHCPCGCNHLFIFKPLSIRNRVA